MFGWRDTGILVCPDDLWAFAWSAPMRELAGKAGMSDVGLKKLLRSHGVSTPPRGHWNRVHAGKPVPERPRAPDRKPGGRGRIRLDARFADLVAQAGPFPVEGPFASRFVPEDLEALRAQELKALGTAGVPRTLCPAHPGLGDLLRKEERRRQKHLASGYGWNEPYFDSPFDQRRLRFLNGLFRALEKRGHSGSAYGEEGRLHPIAMVGEMQVVLDLAAAKDSGRSGRGTWTGPVPLPANTPMALSIGYPPASRWADDDGGRIEGRLAAIAADIIVAGEAGFRRGLREAVEREARRRRQEDERRREKLAALEAQRLGQLKESGELLRQAEDIRALVTRMKAAVMAGEREIDGGELAAWEQWANGHADRLDPVKSGQVLQHLRPPVLEED